MTPNNIRKSASLFIFCKAKDGEPLYLGDVRKWLEEVDTLNLGDDTELEGALYLAIDLEEPLIERSWCGECNSEEPVDFLLQAHDCETEQRKKFPHNFKNEKKKK